MVGRLFRKRHPKVGAPPGSLVISKQSPPPRATMIDFQEDRLEQQSVDDVSAMRSALNEQSVTWIDVQGLGDRRFFEEVGQIFQLHPLLLEDIVNVPQRPKVEAYGDQLLIILRMVRQDDEGQVDMEQISLVIGPGYVLTFQERYGDVLDPVRERIKDPKTRVRRSGADFLAYALIDTVIDAYYPLLEKIGDQLEAMEDEVIDDPTPELLGRLHALKSRLVSLRRGIWPQREAISSLARDDHSLISDHVRIFLRDTLDHCVQTSEVTEMFREMTTGLMNTYLSSVANRTNDVMKVLTIVATIFIPMTFVAGVYGMNFEHMPELHYRWSYPLVWVAMVGLSLVMLYFFRRKGWIE